MTIEHAMDHHVGAPMGAPTDDIEGHAAMMHGTPIRQQASKARRPVHGILLLDKPAGLSSNAALQRVKRLFTAQKAGHTGSLDPIATGMLPVCLGYATRLSQFLLDATKAYEVTFRVGSATDTGDSEGSIISHGPSDPDSMARIEAILPRFIGEIAQTPPMYSALRHQGVRLYDLARKGVVVERQARVITIHALRYLTTRSPDMTIAVQCSKGTYVRTLVEDIAQAAGTCAHVVALRRTAVGPYQADALVGMDQIEEAAAHGPQALDALLLAADSAVDNWPAVLLTKEMAFYVRQGQPVWVPRLPADGMVRLYNERNTFIGVGEVLDGARVAPRHLLRRG